MVGELGFSKSIQILNSLLAMTLLIQYCFAALFWTLQLNGRISPSYSAHSRKRTKQLVITESSPKLARAFLFSVLGGMLLLAFVRALPPALSTMLIVNSGSVP